MRIKWQVAWHGQLFNQRLLKIDDWWTTLADPEELDRLRLRFGSIMQGPHAIASRERLERLEFLFYFSVTYLRKRDIVVQMKGPNGHRSPVENDAWLSLGRERNSAESERKELVHA